MIYIIGNSGMIGKHVISNLDKYDLSHQTIGRSEKCDIFFDLSDPATFNFNKLVENDLVIFLASISNPDECMRNIEIATLINVNNTIKAIKKIIEKKSYVLFASSDMVYSQNNGIVDENTIPRPMKGYGEMKFEVEKYFMDELYFKSMRLSLVCALDDKFTSFLIESSKNKNQSIDVYHPMIRSMIHIKDVVSFIMKFIKSPNEMPKITNLVGPSFVSKYDYASVFSEVLDMRINVTEPPSEFLLSRPKEIYVKSIHLEDVLGEKTLDVLVELKKILIKIVKG